MPTSSDPSIKIVAPSTALQQMCNCVAIAETKSPAESMRELILHTLHTFGNEKASTADEVGYILNTMFGIEVPNHHIQETLDQLVSSGQVNQPPGSNYVLSTVAQTRVKERIDQALLLQERVKVQWLEEIARLFPELNVDLAWDALKDYLSKAFLRHGMQVSVYLDPTIDIPTEYNTSLSILLADSVQAKFAPAQRESARHAISGFLASVGNNADRSRYIAECADGAANYFSLALPSDVSEQFRRNLCAVDLFCDTNFLFGILDLHVHSLVEVSNELVDAIAKNVIPFKLLYHVETLKELNASIYHNGSMLRQKTYSRVLSRAATRSRYVTGMELKYHQKNAESGIDVETFLKPYHHVDVLLDGRNIKSYTPTDERMVERATLETEYRAYLTRINKVKSHSLIVHDVAVLDCVRHLRSEAATSLEAGALLVTCDYSLYRFDNEASRRTHTHTSVVLPNILWQIIRPFIPSSPDFDRSFAETFAIPEFRTIGSDAAKACSKMIGLLATYKDFPEATAVRMLSNDILIDGLQNAQNDEQFNEMVDAAIVSENQVLLEERTALSMQVEGLKADKERVEKEKEIQKKEAEEEAAKANDEIRARREELAKSEASRKSAEKEAEGAASELSRAKTDKTDAERRALRSDVIASILVSIGSFAIFEYVIRTVWKWQWLLGHSNSYSLQGCLFFMLAFSIVGLWVKPWRKILWTVGFLGVLFVVLQLLGGPSRKP